jgi:hypothetical protein
MRPNGASASKLCWNVRPPAISRITSTGLPSLASTRAVDRSSLLEIDDVIRGILYLESATFVTGEILHIDGGQSRGALTSHARIESARSASVGGTAGCGEGYRKG